MENEKKKHNIKNKRNVKTTKNNKHTINKIRKQPNHIYIYICVDCFAFFDFWGLNFWGPQAFPGNSEAM